jgi:hypothetical protein
MTQQFDQYGKPLAGGKLYFFVSGSVSTPQNAFQDSGLTNPWPNPITLDLAGRLPQFFLADGTIKVRLTDKFGVTHLVGDNIAVIGSSSGGGGGGAIPEASIAQTGDLKARYGVGVLTGWCRGNGKTIGNAASSATERAHNTETRALFEYLWNTDPNLIVIPSRGASAAADFDGGKQMTLPDFRGCTLIGMDDMGNTLSGRLPLPVPITGTTTNGSAVVTAMASTANLSVGMNVTGANVPVGTTITAIGTMIGATGTLTNGSATVSALSISTTLLAVGMSVVGSGIQIGTTILTIVSANSITISANPLTGRAGGVATTGVALSFIDPNRITMSANATGTGTGSLTFSIIDGAVLGSRGGVSLQKLTKAHLPNINLGVHIGRDQGSHKHNLDNGALPISAAGSSGSNTIGTGSGNPGSGIATDVLPEMTGVVLLGAESGHNNVQPGVTATVYIKL